VAQGLGGLGGGALTLGGLMFGKDLQKWGRGLFGLQDDYANSGTSYISQPITATPTFDAANSIVQPEIVGDFSGAIGDAAPDLSFDVPDMDILGGGAGDFDIPAFDLGFDSGLDSSTLDLLAKGWGDISF
jgi:hypothetical protein